MMRDIWRNFKNAIHLLLGFIAVTFYSNPSKSLKVIGVTGTDGKTTTSYFLYQLLKLSGKKVMLISTVGVFMNEERISLGFHVTTPSPFVLNNYLKKAKDKGIEYAVIEVSSHALDQHRVFGIDFEIGTITNITNEHLDYHKNINRYLEAKVKLLKKSRIVLLNKMDPFLQTIKEKLNNKKIYTYAVDKDIPDLFISNKDREFYNSQTIYNKKNLTAAVTILSLVGIDINLLRNKIYNIQLPAGRLEFIKKEPFSVIIDFAHTPNAFNSLLPEIKKLNHGKLIHVFGCAGERDRSKRSDMGKLSSKYADIIILTAEDPRSESVETINNEIKKGIDKGFTIIDKNELIKNLSKKIVIDISDRKEAIDFAIKIAAKNDVVVVTGKGPEESMNMGDGELLWNDIEITKEILKKNGK